MAKESETNRLMSLDALRGFDMFFIMGGSQIIIAVCMLFPCALSTFAEGQMHHVQWNEFSFYDMIFPLFLSGVSLPFYGRYFSFSTKRKYF